MQLYNSGRAQTGTKNVQFLQPFKNKVLPKKKDSRIFGSKSDKSTVSKVYNSAKQNGFERIEKEAATQSTSFGFDQYDQPYTISKRQPKSSEKTQEEWKLSF